MGGTRWRTAGLALALVLATCGPGPTSETVGTADPCPGVPPTPLGRPQRGGPVAQFAVAAGGPVWVTASGFPHGGIFDPDLWRTRITIGHADAPPTYDEQRSVVTDVTASVDVVEDAWSRVDVHAGAAWLWSSNGGEVALKTCDGRAVGDVRPVGPDTTAAG